MVQSGKDALCLASLRSDPKRACIRCRKFSLLPPTAPSNPARHSSGIPDTVVMALVGHESAAMSQRYTHVGAKWFKVTATNILPAHLAGE
jgi:hypothetical protein